MENNKTFDFFNFVTDLTIESKRVDMENKKSEIKSLISNLRDRIIDAGEEGRTSIYLKITDSKLNNYILEDINFLRELIDEEIGCGFSTSLNSSGDLDKYLISWKHGVSNKIKERK